MLLYLSHPTVEFDSLYPSNALQRGLYYEMPRKQLGDSFVLENEDGILILEGIVANGSRLLTDFAHRDIPSLFYAALQNESILAKAHGQFFLVYYDKRGKSFKAYTNMSSTVRLYYYCDGEELIFPDKIQRITSTLKAKGKSYGISAFGARMMLSYGYMLEGYTTIKEVRQLPSASVLFWQNGKCETRRYHN